MNDLAWKRVLRVLDALLAATLMTAIAAAGWLDDVDNRYSDRFYQTPGVASPDILIVAIDDATTSRRGKFSSWQRQGMAQAVTYLNDGRPGCRPAAIGIDIFFPGEDYASPKYGNHLAQAAAKYNNVVIASAADVNDRKAAAMKDDPYAPWDMPWKWKRSYPTLSRAVGKSGTGHVNVPNDAYGIMRHALLYVNVEGGGRLDSFARVLYEKWCGAHGKTPNPPPATEGNGLYYMPFTAKSYYSEVSFMKLLDGELEPEAYDGKIVLIGRYGTGTSDIYKTALDPDDWMYGVDFQANAIQAFQRGFFPREAGRKAQLALLFVISAVSEFLFRTWRIRRTAALWAAICLGWVGICWICYHYPAVILHVTWVPFLISLLFVAAVATHARAEEARLLSTLGRYFDPTIMKRLLKGDSEVFRLGGNLRDIAVLFVDVRGFTAMSARLPAPVVVDILNQYLALTTECVRRYHGTLDKFIGDCTMAFWNAPVAQEEFVRLACHAAMDMQGGARALRDSFRERYGIEFSFGIGIHCGKAVVGNIGSAGRMDYTAIGDTVNTAQRLEAGAAGGEILISREVADALGDAAVVAPPTHHVIMKGKAAGFAVLELNSLAPFDKPDRKRGISDIFSRIRRFFRIKPEDEEAAGSWKINTGNRP